MGNMISTFPQKRKSDKKSNLPVESVLAGKLDLSPVGDRPRSGIGSLAILRYVTARLLYILDPNHFTPSSSQESNPCGAPAVFSYMLNKSK